VDPELEGWSVALPEGAAGVAELPDDTSPYDVVERSLDPDGCVGVAEAEAVSWAAPPAAIRAEGSRAV